MSLWSRGRRWARRWTRPQVGAALLGLALGLFGLQALVARWQWERDRVVELAVDGEEVRSLSDADDDRTHGALADLADAGVSAVAIYWDPSYALPGVLREWEARVPEDLTVTLRPEASPFSDWRHRWPRAARLNRVSFPVVTHALFSGPSVLGFPVMGPVQAWISSTSLTLPWLEFSRQRGTSGLLAAFPERVIRAHTLSEEEMAQAGPDRVVARYLRAVRERGARFLYVRLFPGLSSDDNLVFVRRLADALKEEGFELGRARPRYADFSPPLWRWPSPVRQFLAFLLAVAGPFLALRWVCERPATWESPAQLTGVSLAIAFSIAALFSTPDFTLGFVGFRGVKLALLLPLIAALFYFYRAREIRHFLQEPVNVERLVWGGDLIGCVGYYVLRSGHGTSVDAGGTELQIRGWLERALGVRPRFKEFFIGHPALLLGFYLRARFPKGAEVFPDRPGPWAQALHFIFHDARPFLMVGFVGQLSIVNTFCHAHTPLGVSALRTFHGLWLGGLFGAAVLGAFRWAHARWSARPA